MAEGIFNKLAEEKGLNITAESFGIATVTGIPVSENSVTACKELGVDLSQNKSTSVEDVELEKYERLYCMSPSHARVLSECYFVPLGDIDILGVGDPYGGSLEVYRACRDEIYNSVKEIIKSYEDRKDD